MAVRFRASDKFDKMSRNSYSISMKTIVSEKGQITIPKAVRDQLGLRNGTRLEITAERGRLIGIKAVDADVVSRWRGRGKLPVGRTTDEYLRTIRDADGR